MRNCTYIPLVVLLLLVGGCSCDPQPGPNPKPDPKPNPDPVPNAKLQAENVKAAEATPEFNPMFITVGGGVAFDIVVVGGTGDVVAPTSAELPKSWAAPKADASGRRFTYSGKMPMGTTGDYKMHFTTTVGGTAADPCDVVVPTWAFKQTANPAQKCQPGAAGANAPCGQMTLIRSFSDELGKKASVTVEVTSNFLVEGDIVFVSYSADDVSDEHKLLKVEIPPVDHAGDPQTVTIALTGWQKTGKISAGRPLMVRIQKRLDPPNRPVEVKALLLHVN